MARQIGGPWIIAGDFNAKATEWGDKTTDPRGRKILDLVGRLGLMVANTGDATTFRRPGCQETTPDITLISEEIALKVKNWKVMEDFTGSDHQYITYTVNEENTSSRESRRRNTGTTKWNVSRLKAETLIAYIDRHLAICDRARNAIQLTHWTMRGISRGCDASMPRIRERGRRKAMYWWTPEIAELRRICLQTRRKYTRARKRSPANLEQEQHKNAKRELKLAIERSKRQKFEELRNEINNNPWGLGYKVVTQRLKGKSGAELMDSETAKHIVDTLFPTHEELNEEMVLTTENFQLFTEEEVISAAKSLGGKKAPGPDGIPAEVIKCIAENRPNILLRVFNLCCASGIFPDTWKRQKLVLIEKGKGDPTQPSSYRPLCMLDVAGKLFEKLIRGRLTMEIEKAGGLSARQHGFRKGKSTLGALEDVVLSVEQAQQGNNHSRNITLLATLDVRNAFNSLQWKDIINALKSHFSVPAYLLNIIRSYLSNRVLLYDTKSGIEEKKITSGAAQGSILGPDLWNITYDEILKLEMPDDTHLVGYADDIAAVITARNTRDAERKLKMVMLRAKIWLEQHGLTLAAEKTELILLTRKHIPLTIDLNVLGTMVTTKNVLKYLGIRFDNRLRFNHQINHAADKAGKIIGMLSRLMANVKGPTQSKRKLLMDTANSVLLYGCEVWGKALRCQNRRRTLLAVQRTSALRIASAYRTVSLDAVMIISSSIPIDLLIEERCKIWTERKRGNDVDAKEIRKEIIGKLQERWSSSINGRWTARLIPRIDAWYNRRDGETNYYLTQMLSGHGYFRKYLFQTEKVNDPICIYGDGAVDDSEHTFF